MRVISLLISLLMAGGLLADTVTLRTGRVIQGTYLGGTSRQVRMEVGESIETFSVSDIASIRFEGPAARSAAAAPSQEASKPAGRLARRDSSNVLRPDPASSSAASRLAVEIPAETALTVRMVDPVDSEVNRLGEEFRATLDEPVMVDGETVIPRGANVVVKLVDDKTAGRLTGRSELKLDVVSVEVKGRTVDVNTTEVTEQSESRTGKTARNVGGGAALGAIIGAVAGGGKGAAIGATAGAGAGAAVQVLTKGPKVRIPSETRLTFTLRDAVKI